MLVFRRPHKKSDPVHTGLFFHLVGSLPSAFAVLYFWALGSVGLRLFEALLFAEGVLKLCKLP